MGATGKRMGPAAARCARRERGAIRRPWATIRRGQPLARLGYPSLSGLPQMVQARGDDQGLEQSPANIASWHVATNKAFSGCERPAAQRSRPTRRGQALAQPGRRAVLGGLGAPPDSASALRVGCGTHRAGMVLQRVRTVQGWGVLAADGPQPPLVASLLPLAVWAGAPAFAGRRNATPTARPGRQAVRALSTRPPRLGFVHYDSGTNVVGAPTSAQAAVRNAAASDPSRCPDSRIAIAPDRPASSDSIMGA